MENILTKWNDFINSLVKIDFVTLKKGDKVFDIVNGVGIIKEIFLKKYNVYCINVEFKEIDFIQTYTFDGKSIKHHKNPSLFKYHKEFDENNICTWKLLNVGMMGFDDYEYHTSCGIIVSKTVIVNELSNYCGNCGKKVKQT